MKKYNTFISFSYEEENLKIVQKIIDNLERTKISVDYSEKKDRSDYTSESIWTHLLNRIKGSTITIVLLTDDLFSHNKEKINYKNGDFLNSGWLYKEISASLRNHKNNNINGVICVVPNENKLDKICDDISILPPILRDNFFNLNENWANKNNQKNIDHSYLEIVSLEEFSNDAINIIEEAWEKREIQIKSDNNAYDIDYEPHNK